MLKKYAFPVTESKTEKSKSALVPTVSEVTEAQTHTNDIPVITPETIPEEKTNIEKFFKNSGINVIRKNSPEYEDIIYLVNEIAACLPEGEDFLHALRKSLPTPEGNFNYRTSNISENIRKKISRMVSVMKNCGIFAEINMNDKFISGNVSTSYRVRNFLSGQWLELYSQQKAMETVAKIAESRNLPYELFCNLIVADEKGANHEIDLMFAVGDKIFGAEIKSGLNFHDYDKYRITAEWMHLIPDRFLLLNSTLTDENEVKCISYFYRYIICNIKSYEKSLETMITKAIDA